MHKQRQQVIGVTFALLMTTAAVSAGASVAAIAEPSIDRPSPTATALTRPGEPDDQEGHKSIGSQQPALTVSTLVVQNNSILAANTTSQADQASDSETEEAETEGVRAVPAVEPVSVTIGVIGILISTAGLVYAISSGPTRAEQPVVKKSEIHLAKMPDPQGKFHVGDKIDFKASARFSTGSCTDDNQGTAILSLIVNNRNAGGKTFKRLGAGTFSESIKGDFIGVNHGDDAEVAVDVHVLGTECSDVFWKSDPLATKSKRKAFDSISVNHPLDVQHTVPKRALDHVDSGGESVDVRLQATSKTQATAKIEDTIFGRVKHPPRTSNDGWEELLVFDPEYIDHPSSVTGEKEETVLQTRYADHYKHPCKEPEWAHTKVRVLQIEENTGSGQSYIFVRIPVDQFDGARDTDWTDSIAIQEHHLEDTVQCDTGHVDGVNIDIPEGAPFAVPESHTDPGNTSVNESFTNTTSAPPEENLTRKRITATGQIINRTSVPIAGVNLTLTGNRTTVTTTTNQTGQFAVEANLTSQVQVTYGDGEWNQSYNTTVHRSELANGTALTLLPKTMPELTGRVTNQNGTPLTAEIAIVNRTGGARPVDVTDSNGSFTVPSLPKRGLLTDPNNVTLRITLREDWGRSFDRTRRERRVSFANQTTLSLSPVVFTERSTANQTSVTYTARLVQHNPITNRTQSVEGVRLIVSENATGAHVANATTNETGQLTITVPTGKSLDFESPNLAEYGVPADRVNGTNVTLRRNADLGVKELPPARSIVNSSSTRVTAASLSNRSVKAGDSVTIEMTIAHSGADGGSIVIPITADGTLIDTETVALPSNTSRTVTTSVRFTRTGTVGVKVGNLRVGSVTVSGDGVGSYAGGDNRVQTDELRQAISDWVGGTIDTDLLRQVISAWVKRSTV